MNTGITRANSTSACPRHRRSARACRSRRTLAVGAYGLSPLTWLSLTKVPAMVPDQPYKRAFRGDCIARHARFSYRDEWAIAWRQATALSIAAMKRIVAATALVPGRMVCRLRGGVGLRTWTIVAPIVGRGARDADRDRSSWRHLGSPRRERCEVLRRQRQPAPRRVHSRGPSSAAKRSNVATLTTIPGRQTWDETEESRDRGRGSLAAPGGIRCRAHPRLD